jgi:hypothetical protein
MVGLIDKETKAMKWEHRDDSSSGEGQCGRLFEVTPEGEIVWEYVSPFMGPDRHGDPSNEVFRAYRHAPDSPQIRNRVKSIYD